MSRTQLDLALWALPPTPERIADLFLRLGIKGAPNEADMCPVACYLSQFVDGDAYVYVELVSEERMEYVAICSGGGVGEQRQLPEAVARFVYLFDLAEDEVYRRLIEEGAMI